MSAVTQTTSKKRQVAPLVAAGIAAALAMGGGTLALWSANDTFDGGTITAGDLNLVASSTDGWYDVSADRADATTTIVPAIPESAPEAGDGQAALMGHVITDIATWRMVPGDTIARVFDASVTLEGDNLVASLGMTQGAVVQPGQGTLVDPDGSMSAAVDPGPSGDEWYLNGGFETDGVDSNPATTNDSDLTYTYSVYQAGTLIAADVPVADIATAGVLYLAAPDAGQAAGLSDGLDTTTPVHQMTSTTESFTIVVTATFDASNNDREDVTAKSVLGELTMTLQQVRTAGIGQFVP